MVSWRVFLLKGMQMVAEALAAAAIAVLGPYLVAGATSAAETLGEELVKKSGTLLLKVRDWVAPDPRAQKALAHFEEDPETYGSAAENSLARVLAAHPETQAALRAELDGLGDQIVVRQRITTLAGKLTGIKLESVDRAFKTLVEQTVDRIDQTGEATGLHIKSI